MYVSRTFLWLLWNSKEPPDPSLPGLCLRLLYLLKHWLWGPGRWSCTGHMHQPCPYSTEKSSCSNHRKHGGLSSDRQMEEETPQEDVQLLGHVGATTTGRDLNQWNMSLERIYMATMSGAINTATCHLHCGKSWTKEVSQNFISLWPLVALVYVRNSDIWCSNRGKMNPDLFPRMCPIIQQCMIPLY